MESQTEFPHPYVAVDVVLLTVEEGHLEVMLLDRRNDPRGWSLPGQFVQIDESLDDCAGRLLRDKAQLRRRPDLMPLRPFGELDRDPRGRVIALPYIALVDVDRFEPSTSDNIAMAEVEWSDNGPRVTVGEEDVPLQFDHRDILAEAILELRRLLALGDSRLLRQLLPDRFTLRQLQEVHEAVLGQEVNTDSFRRKVLDSGLVEKTGDHETDVSHRPAALFTWTHAQEMKNRPRNSDHDRD